MLIKILLGLGVLVAVLAIVVAMQPAAFSVERSATIHAPSSLLYGYIATPRAHEAWSPFFKINQFCEMSPPNTLKPNFS